MGLEARTLHEADNWLVINDFSDAFNTVKINLVFAEVSNYVTGLTPSVGKCYGTRPAPASFRMDSAGIKTMACSSGVQPGDSVRSAMLCLTFRPG